MAKKKPAPAKVESIRHKDKRKNIPTEELRDFVAEDEHAPKTMLYRGFSTLKPKALAELSRRSRRCAELVRQGKEMHAHWQPLLAASLAELRSQYAPKGSEDDACADAGEDADTADDAEPDEWTGVECLDWRRQGNRCTLDGQPARIIGRTAPYATIEPVDLDAEPIDCPWDVVAQVLDERDGAFVSADAE